MKRDWHLDAGSALQLTSTARATGGSGFGTGQGPRRHLAGDDHGGLLAGHWAKSAHGEQTRKRGRLGGD